MDCHEIHHFVTVFFYINKYINNCTCRNVQKTNNYFVKYHSVNLYAILI